MSNKKITITYNGSEILPETEVTSSAVTYNGTTIIADGVYSSTLNTKNKICTSNIQVGTKILNCNGKFMTDYVSIESKLVVPSLNEASWSYISAAGSSASSYWSVGDTKTGAYINSESHPYRIVEFNHSGDAGNITFEQTDLMANVYALKSSSMATTGSWANTDLITTINNFSITSDLSAVIKTASKPCFTSISNPESQISVSSRLWIMSLNEISGTSSEGTEYAYYVNAGSTTDSRIKTRSGSGSGYWLRTGLGYSYRSGQPYAFFATITSSGSGSSEFSDSTLGVAPCFCV